MEKSKRIAELKKKIKNGTYDWEAAVKGAASKITENPEVLLWR